MATTAGRHRLACLAYGTGLFGRAVLQKEFFEAARHWARDWRALELTQAHHGKRISAAYQLPQAMFSSSSGFQHSGPALGSLGC